MARLAYALCSRVAGDCHLNRKPDDLIRSAGFRIDGLETGYVKGPQPMTFFHSGSARPSHLDSLDCHMMVDGKGYNGVAMEDITPQAVARKGVSML